MSRKEDDSPVSTPERRSVSGVGDRPTDDAPDGPPVRPANPMDAIRGARVLRGSSADAPRHTAVETAIDASARATPPGAGRPATVAEQAISAPAGAKATVAEQAVQRSEVPRATIAGQAIAPGGNAARATLTGNDLVRLHEGSERAVQRADQPTLTGNLQPVREAEDAARGGRRRIDAGRVLPLALFVIVAMAAAVLATLAVVERTEAATEIIDDGASDLSVGQEARLGETVTLPATEAIIGLTDDNREAVLNLCFRLSDNPNHECRPAHFERIGELPLRHIAVPALQVHRHEVSNQQLDDCARAGACAPRNWDECQFWSLRGFELGSRVPEAMRQPALPAVCVTFDEAERYCAHVGMRLPTDVEWERIARHGDDRMQPWGRFWTPALLNWGERDMTGFPIPGRLDGADLTASVFDYEDGASPAGILNLLGNAAEWTRRTSRGDELPDPPSAIRGGSYVDDIRNLRITREEPVPPDERRSTIGFRCVAPLDR